MKNQHVTSSVRCLAAVITALSGLGCAQPDASTEGPQLSGISSALTFDGLPACTFLRSGQVYYVNELDEFYYCDRTSWQVLELQGLDGLDGVSWVVAATAASERACEAGGVSVISGPDSDRDGVIDEIFGQETICNGVDGEDGSSCSAEDNEDGSVTVSCTDGTSAILRNGQDGSDGEDGSSCTVSDNGDGTSTLSCPDGTSAIIVNADDPTEPEDPTDPGSEPEDPTDPQGPGSEPEDPTDPGSEDPGSEPEDPGTDDPIDDGIPCSTTEELNTIECQSKTIFVTSVTHTGNLLEEAQNIACAVSTGLEGADCLCQRAAEEGELSGEYKAWLGTADGVSPLTRFAASTSDIRQPYFWPDHSTFVAADFADLVDGMLDAPIRMDEYGQIVGDGEEPLVWTNVSPDGSPAGYEDCRGWAQHNAPGAAGIFLEQNDVWTRAAVRDCSQRARLYCVEQ